jgi:hypothetical protein
MRQISVDKLPARTYARPVTVFGVGGRSSVLRLRLELALWPYFGPVARRAVIHAALLQPLGTCASAALLEAEARQHPPRIPELVVADALSEPERHVLPAH